jgi:hypothetical protein
MPNLKDISFETVASMVERVNLQFAKMRLKRMVLKLLAEAASEQFNESALQSRTLKNKLIEINEGLNTVVFQRDPNGHQREKVQKMLEEEFSTNGLFKKIKSQVDDSIDQLKAKAHSDLENTLALIEQSEVTDVSDKQWSENEEVLYRGWAKKHALHSLHQRNNAFANALVTSQEINSKCRYIE